MENQNTRQLIQDFKQHLDDHDGEIAYWGENIELPIASVKTTAASPIFTPALKPPAVAAASSAEKTKALDALRVKTIGDCHRCPLGDTRIKIVFGVGNPQADVMFVGEGPGFDEDHQGEPFVGKAGQLLDKIIAAIQLDRTKVYIANVVKCHPMVDATQPDKRGNDRPPAPEEIEKCRPFLIEQIRIIQPRIIVTLGATAAKAVLETKQGITAIRGQVFNVELVPGIPPFQVLPTFHPAALLRDETLKRPVWEDMKKLKELLSAAE